MTAVAIGKKGNITFGVVDAMVEVIKNTQSYLDCRIENKITAIDSTNQFLFLLGEQYIAFGATFLNDWCKMNSILLNLFNTNNFVELLKVATKYRSFSEQIMNVNSINQQSSQIYILDSSRIKEYNVTFNKQADEFELIDEKEHPDDTCFINYKGNIVPVKLTFDNNIINSSIAELEKEHLSRKQNVLVNGKNPLRYDFDNRFSSVLFIDGTLHQIFPFRDLTEMFLSFSPAHNFINNPSFRFSPNIV